MEVGCGEGNLQTDEELGVGYNTRVGMAPELGTASELVGLVK